jgi:hypothetical protein
MGMNRKQRMSLTALFVTALGVTLASPSSASITPTPDEVNAIQIVAQGETATGGWVEFTGTGSITLGGSDDHGSAVARAVKEVGGGTWYFGASLNAAGQKTCSSQYYHPKVTHGSSVSMDGYYSKDHGVAKGKTSDALIKRHTTATCRAFYTKD